MRRWFLRRESISRAEAFVPIDVIRTGVPRPRTAARRVQRETQPPFALAELRLRARALDSLPRPLADVANEVHLRRRPHSRRPAVDAERAVPPAVFPDQQAGKCRDVATKKRGPLLLREAYVRPHIVDGDHIAAFVRR